MLCDGFATDVPGRGDTNLNNWEAPVLSLHIIVFFELLKEQKKLAL
jgi:hypothetical protein